MSLRDRLISLRCVMLRYNPIRHEVGLVTVGSPGPDAPVLVTGNYFHTVKRLLRALEGVDCHVLVADSAGINVWCASGVCDFNEHKIADAIHATGLDEVVSHRELVLPQLAAVGVDLQKLEAESGFRGRWGPASLFDIPAYLRAGQKATAAMRVVRFPLSDRLYNAIGIFNVFLLLPIFAWVFFSTEAVHILLLANIVNIFGIFILYEHLPFRWPSNNSLLVGGLFCAALLLDGLFFRPVPGGLLAWRIAGAAFVALMVAIDMLGSTPDYKATIGHWLCTGDNRSLFQPEVLEHCTGCGSCEEVCPKGIFTFPEGGGGAIAVDLSRECCECLACAKQCPVTAIVNANGTVHKNDIKSLHNLDEIMVSRDE